MVVEKNMELHQGKAKFLESWGKLGSNWGVSRTMAQVHALLLISPEALCADEIMEQLVISRGNVNLNVRALCDWGLVHKSLKQGDRKEYFLAEKDMTKVMKQIILQRKKKELDPLIEVLNEISCVKSCCEKSDEYCKVVNDLKIYSKKADKTLTHLINSEQNWIYNTLFKVLR